LRAGIEAFPVCSLSPYCLYESTSFGAVATHSFPISRSQRRNPAPCACQGHLPQVQEKKKKNIGNEEKKEKQRGEKVKKEKEKKGKKIQAENNQPPQQNT